MTFRPYERPLKIYKINIKRDPAYAANVVSVVSNSELVWERIVVYIYIYIRI